MAICLCGFLLQLGATQTAQAGSLPTLGLAQRLRPMAAPQNVEHVDASSMPILLVFFLW